MDIVRHAAIEKDFKKLKRFPAPKGSLEAWERLFCLKGIHETPGMKAYDKFKDLKIYKARVVPLKENCGKSDGYRVVFESLENGKYKVLAFSRHGIHRSEQDLIMLVKERIAYE
ncbi:MAG: hypothetical protein V1770_00515 [bacterium]